MTGDIYTFQLTDADGEPHDYEIQRPHRPIERGNQWWGGIKLLNTVVRAAGDPIMEVVNSNIGQLIEQFMEGGAGVDLEEGEDVLDALDQIDTDDLSELDLELPTAWHAFLEAVERVDTEQLFLQLLHHTSRDAIPLSSEDNFNEAFERNYMEMIRASFEVAKYNGFFGRLATLADGEEAV